MTEHSTAQQQFADRLRERALGKQGHPARSAALRRRASTAATARFADRLRSSLGVR